MKINKAELQQALEKVKPGLANKEIIEQSTSFAFVDDKVITYNDEISISHPVKGLNITGAIKADEFYQFLNRIPQKQEEINIEQEENQLLVTAKRAKAGFVLQKEIVLPIEEIGEITKWKKLPEGFIEGLDFCRLSCSKDMSRPVLTCLHIQKNGMIEASDGFQLTTCQLAKGVPVASFLFPASLAAILSRYSITQIAEGTGWVHFQTDDGTILSCRIFSENYPEVSRILAVEGTTIKLPAKLNKVLERAEIFAKKEFDRDTEVTVQIADEHMQISARSDFGWFKESLRIQYKEDPIAFRIHPGFLARMLDKVQKGVVGHDRIKFEGENWAHVLILVTVKDIEEEK